MPKFPQYFFLFLLVIIPSLAGGEQREKIGIVLNESIYRDQIADLAQEDFHFEIYDLFISPLLDQYLQEHKDEVELSQAEINQFVIYYQKQHDKELKGKKKEMLKKMQAIMDELNLATISQARKDELVGELFYLRTELEPPGIDYAMFVLPHWKIQNHLYKKYGGGRLIWQERGLEVFDAQYKWIREQETKGLFSFIDDELRGKFYHYWTDQDHGSSLISDKKRINKEFLKPVWFSVKIKEKKGCFTKAIPKSAKVCSIYKRFYK